MTSYLFGAAVGVLALHGYEKWRAKKPTGPYPRSSEVVNASAFR